MSEPINVTVIPDGPLKISNAGSVSFCGQALAAEGDLYLCRCGDSSKAPFCDGTHAKMGFKGSSPDAPEGEIRVWEGKTLRTYFNKTTCMHVFYCKPLKELRAREEAGDAEAAVEIMRVVESCPSGALSYETKVDLPEPTPPERVAVEIMEGGEIRLQAEFDINAPLQERQIANKATLCRCSMSKNKPWCDGRHKGRKDFR